MLLSKGMGLRAGNKPMAAYTRRPGERHGWTEESGWCPEATALGATALYILKRKRQDGPMQPDGSDFPRDAILDSISDGAFTVDTDWRIMSFNRAAEKITGVPQEQALGRRCCEVLRASICEGFCALKRTLSTGQPVVNKAVYILDSKGTITGAVFIAAGVYYCLIHIYGLSFL